MRTDFSAEQLCDPHLADAERNLRACVHCGICTATCPTYVLLGDERDGPRGRIVLMQNMLQAGGAPSPQTVLHLDRCLSCLGCRTACPSGVDYARLIDKARAHVEENYRRPVAERCTRWLIANVLTRPSLAKFAVGLARIFAPVSTRFPGTFGKMARLAVKAPWSGGGLARAPDATHKIALLPGCAQQALAPQIDAAASRVLARQGIALAPLHGAQCCGALAHHLGKTDRAKAFARRVIASFEQMRDAEAMLATASGCAAHMAEYPHLFADEPEWKVRAEAFVVKVREFSQLAAPRAGGSRRALRVAWQVPCSLQHGLRGGAEGEALIRAAGFEAVAIPEGHLCCGSAGSYSLLQPEIAGRLRARKLENCKSSEADIIATANVGCLSHLSGPDAPPVVHLAELLDWAEGGPTPLALKAFANLAVETPPPAL
ncbi:MAG: glycolate oxidase subunit GlcF [Rhizomicrobium sp.]